MPIMQKSTKEDIIVQILNMINEKGKVSLNESDIRKNIGNYVFETFRDMEEIEDMAKTAALRRFEGYAKQAMNYMPVFKQVGMQMILFAKQEPELFKFAFMSKDNNPADDFDGIFSKLGITADVCVYVIQKDYDLKEEYAKILFEHVWMYTFGMSCLCASGMCEFSDEQINRMLSTQFIAMITLIKSGKIDEIASEPGNRIYMTAN